jgi:acyl-CoA dehydrogenase
MFDKLISVNAVGAYARVRKQFRVPIAEMGGVQEALVTILIFHGSLLKRKITSSFAQGRIASEAYILTSAQMLINSMLAKHEQPAVLSAVMKYETTSRSRKVVNDGNEHDLEYMLLDSLK